MGQLAAVKGENPGGLQVDDARKKGLTESRIQRRKAEQFDMMTVEISPGILAICALFFSCSSRRSEAGKQQVCSAWLGVSAPHVAAA